MPLEALAEGCEARCPGCDHRALTAEESAAQKQAWLAKALAPWSRGLEPLRQAQANERWNYRERVALRTEWDGRRWQAGLLVRKPGTRGQGREDFELIAIPRCPVHAARVRESVEAFCAALPGPPELELAFIVVSGELLTLVARNREAPAGLAAQLGPARAIDPERLGLKGVFLNLNPSAGTRVHSNHNWHPLWGEESARRHGMHYGPRSFQQQLGRLYGDALSEAAAYLAPRPGDRVVDLCSGVGASLARWRSAGAEALGVELGGEAARFLALNAGEGSALRGRASERIPQLDEWARGVDASAGARVLAFANPPRLGLEDEVTAWLAERLQPARIAYLSCSAGTLARDLERMQAAGYAVQRIIPYDFFPQTRHVESLALLERK